MTEKDLMLSFYWSFHVVERDTATVKELLVSNFPKSLSTVTRYDLIGFFLYQSL